MVLSRKSAASLLLLFLAGIAVQSVSAHEQASDEPAEDDEAGDEELVSVSLVLSEETYDPTKPSTGVIKCVVKNGTAAAVRVPEEYDAEQVLLMSGGLTLYPAPRARSETKPVDGESAKPMLLEPGEERVVFELPLDEILLKDDESRKKWRWDWRRRPEPPRSPIHRWRRLGYNATATFLVNIKFGREIVRSNSVELKVTPTDPAK